MNKTKLVHHDRVSSLYQPTATNISRHYGLSLENSVNTYLNSFCFGFRVTDENTMEIAEMVLNRVNKSLVQKVQALGVNAIGISGKDGGLLKVTKKYADGKDIGYVGDVQEVNAKVLYDLLEKDFLPIICPIGLGEDYNSYNINADDAACAIAKAMDAEKLAFLTDIEGVYANPDDPKSLISELCHSGWYVT